MSNNRSVRFPDDPGNRSSRRSRDSGVGSSSTEQAGTGGRPDRRFTVQDREEQWRNPRALQEALDTATEALEKYKKKCLELDQAVSTGKKDLRESEARWRAQCDHNEELKQENGLLREQVIAHKDAFDDMRDQRDDWRQKYLSETSPVSGVPMMSGGSGESSDGIKRTKSKRDSGKDQKARLKERINKGTVDSEAPSSKSHHGSHKTRERRRSISVSTSSRTPYIEEPPKDRSRPPLTRGYDNYTTAPIASTSISRTDAYVAISTVPRTTEPTVSSTYRTAGYQTGDYVPHPLPPDNHSERGRRHH
ncbi:hypothetical protein BJ170DRAFT_593810 [Xylariales sp. AK1849]|nr:hypothetical protein BJ170DRAFT_593810 [Xylariales sp. AK1849]